MRHSIILGLELELGLLNAPELTTRRERVCARLIEAVAGTQAHAPGLHAKQKHTIFLANGAAFGLEPPGWIVPEYDTPECASPFDLAAAVTAGMRLLAAAAAQVDVEWRSEAKVRRGPRGPLRFVAASDFYQQDDRSLGHHECYGIRAAAGSQGKLHHAILPWLVYRQLLTEPGYLSPDAAAVDGFGLSPRAQHMVTTSGPATTGERAMVTSSRAAHAGNGWIRLHVIAAGATVSPWAIAVRHGVTALLLLMARRGWQPPPGIYPHDPVRELNALAANPSHACRTHANTTITAHAALAELLAAARRCHAEEPLAPWADRILAEWERGLALAGKPERPALASRPGDPAPGDGDDDAALFLEHALRRRLLGRLLAENGVTAREFHFWYHFLRHVDRFRRNPGVPLPYAASGEALRALVEPARLPALDAILAAGQVSWNDLPGKRRLIERTWSADIELSRIAGGIAELQSRLRAAHGAEVVSEEEIDRARSEPPPGTRAAARSALIRQHAGDRSLRVTWNEVQLADRCYRMPSPLASRMPHALPALDSALPPHCRTPGSLRPPVAGSAARASTAASTAASALRAEWNEYVRARREWSQRRREIQLYGITSRLGPLFAQRPPERPPDVLAPAGPDPAPDP